MVLSPFSLEDSPGVRAAVGARSHPHRHVHLWLDMYGVLVGWFVVWLVFNRKPDPAGDTLSERDAHVLQDCGDQLCAMEHIDSMTIPKLSPKTAAHSKIIFPLFNVKKSIKINGSP